jgi:hypothetical protein
MDTVPPYPVEVTPGDPASPVGIVTLWTRQERILRGLPRELYAACGNLYSVWGISLLVQSILARPTIRYLVVCGVDFADSGKALVALCEHGLAADGKVVGTDTRLDVDATAVARFREQVALIDLRGCTRTAEVAAAIRALPAAPPAAGRVRRPAAASPRSPWPEPASLTAVGAAPSSPAATGGDAGDAEPEAAAEADVPYAEGVARDAVGETAAPGAEGQRPAGRATGQAAAPAACSPGSPTTKAPGRAAARLEPDPLGNFLIAVGAGEIVAAHATTTGGPTGQRFSGRTAAEVYRAILDAALVSRLDHAAYLGAELARAEIALRAGLPYRQDSPLRLPTRP